MTAFRRFALAVTMLTNAAACGSNGGDARAEHSAPNVASAGSRSRSAVRTADRPRTGCDWIAVAEVEAILGPLAGPPVGHDETCRYPLPLDSTTARRRADYGSGWGSNAPVRRDPDVDKVAMVLVVELNGDVTNERAGGIVGTMLGSVFADAAGKDAPPSDSSRRRDAPPPPDGWDFATPPEGKRDFWGRIGHITVRVEENVMIEAIPAEKKSALAALVRDRIPDLPFRVVRIDDAETVAPPSGPDPCSLLTRSEAESVLGKLVVAPYRSHDGGPHVDERGTSCAYYTAGHRVFVVIPHWTDGKRDLALIRGAGNLIAALAGDRDGAAADTLDGSWDDVALGLDGNLVFLKGDRLLEIAFATSSADQAGAVKLARIALERLAVGLPGRP